jgi:hypothetical protein
MPQLDPQIEGFEAARQQILSWRRGGPAQFAVDALGIPAEWDEALQSGVLKWQWDASNLLVKRGRLSIRSGHNVGKSAFLSWTILWAHTCYHPVKGGCTAPTATQLSDVLWSELSRWHRVFKERMPVLGNKFNCKSDTFEMLEAPKESFSVARTARPEKPDALQGLHAHGGIVLMLADEAPGVGDPVFEAARSALAGKNTFAVLAGNPTRLSGLFYDTHHKLKPLWGTVQVNGEECPLQSQQFRDEIIFQYGKDSNMYRVRVLGDFPTAEEDTVISMSLCADALVRDVKPFGSTVWGVDVARFGSDRTVLVKRCENATLAPHKAWSGQDTMQTAGRVYAEWLDTPLEDRPKIIFVDVIGIGAGVTDRLLELQLPVVGVNVAESASADDRYLRQRDELWFRARQWLEKKNCRLVEDEVLCAELCLPRYSYQSNGKLKVESKDDMKKRMPRSPDVADAFCLTFGDAAQHMNQQSYEPTYFADY